MCMDLCTYCIIRCIIYTYICIFPHKHTHLNKTKKNIYIYIYIYISHWSLLQWWWLPGLAVRAHVRWHRKALHGILAVASWVNSKTYAKSLYFKTTSIFVLRHPSLANLVILVGFGTIWLYRSQLCFFVICLFLLVVEISAEMCVEY